MPKKRPDSTEFFRQIYGPVERLIEERAIPDAREEFNRKRRERAREYMRGWRAKKYPKLSPEARLAIRRVNMAKAQAAKTPQQVSYIASLARRTRIANLGPEGRRKLRERGRKLMTAHNERLGSDALRALQELGVLARLGVTAEWPFKPPRLKRNEKKRFEAGERVMAADIMYPAGGCPICNKRDDAEKTP